MPKSLGPEKITVLCNWISQTLTYSLSKLVSGQNPNWGKLQWVESNTDDDNYARIDILKASDDSVLVSGLTYTADGYDMSDYPAIGVLNIKVRVRLYRVTGNPKVSRLEVRHKIYSDYPT